MFRVDVFHEAFFQHIPAPYPVQTTSKYFECDVCVPLVTENDLERNICFIADIDVHTC